MRKNRFQIVLCHGPVVVRVLQRFLVMADALEYVARHAAKYEGRDGQRWAAIVPMNVEVHTVANMPRKWPKRGLSA